jgi:hypothetical protein
MAVKKFRTFFFETIVDVILSLHKAGQNCTWINQKMASLIVIKNGKYFEKMRKTKMHN